MTMTDRLAALFGSAVGMLPTAPERSLQLFTEITTIDEAACDAWVGRIRCGDTDRATLFRAWYSRGAFGQLAGAAEISMNGLEARVEIGGPFGTITYPVNSPLSITLGFAVHEATVGNHADAMEALDGVQGGADHLVAWARAVVYGSAERWADVIDEVRGAGAWPDKFLGAAANVAHGVAAANLGLFNEAERRLTEANASPAGEACGPAIAWYLAMTRRSLGNEESGVVAGHQSGAEGGGSTGGFEPSARHHDGREDRGPNGSVGSRQRCSRRLGSREAALRSAGRTEPPDRAEPRQGADRKVPGRNADGQGAGSQGNEGGPAVQARHLHRPPGHR
jgi:hypothetical protein